METDETHRSLPWDVYVFSAWRLSQESVSKAATVIGSCICTSLVIYTYIIYVPFLM